jgi:hypothetical protein
MLLRQTVGARGLKTGVKVGFIHWSRDSAVSVLDNVKVKIAEKPT